MIEAGRGYTKVLKTAYQSVYACIHQTENSRLRVARRRQSKTGCGGENTCKHWRCMTSLIRVRRSFSWSLKFFFLQPSLHPLKSITTDVCARTVTQSHTHTQRAHRSWVSLHRAKSTQPATSGKHFDQISGTNSIYRSQKLSRPLSEPFVQRGVRREEGRKSTNGCKEVPWLLTNITRGGVCFMYTRTTNIKTTDSQWTPDSLCNL